MELASTTDPREITGILANRVRRPRRAHAVHTLVCSPWEAARAVSDWPPDNDTSIEAVDDFCPECWQAVAVDKTIRRQLGNAVPKTDAQLARIKAAMAANFLFAHPDEDQTFTMLYALRPPCSHTSSGKTSERLAATDRT